MLDSSIARVIGPTPPGFGETQAGHVVHVLRDVARELAVHAGHADVEHRGAGLDHVAGDDARHAGRGHHDVGGADVRGEVTGAGVAQGDRGVLAAPGEQQAQRPAHGDAAADHDHVGPRDGDVVAAEQLDDAVGRAGQRGVLAEHQPAEVGRVQAVGVLVRVDQREHPVRVHVPGQRELDDVAGAGRVGVEPGDVLLHLGLRGGLRQVHPDRLDADLGAVLVLAVDVPPRARVVPDQDGAEAGHDAALLELGDALGELALDGLGGGGAVEDLCGHRGHPISGRSAGCR